MITSAVAAATAAAAAAAGMLSAFAPRMTGSQDLCLQHVGLPGCIFSCMPVLLISLFATAAAAAAAAASLTAGMLSAIATHNTGAKT
jgi:hypothetical protein